MHVERAQHRLGPARRRAPPAGCAARRRRRPSRRSATVCRVRATCRSRNRSASARVRGALPLAWAARRWKRTSSSTKSSGSSRLRVELLHEVGERRQVLRRGPLRAQQAGRRLDRAARLQQLAQLLALELVAIGEQGVGDGDRAHERAAARAAAHVEDAGAPQLVERVAHDRARDAEARGELVVARQPRARRDRAGPDAVDERAHDAVGRARQLDRGKVGGCDVRHRFQEERERRYDRAVGSNVKRVDE